MTVPDQLTLARALAVPVVVVLFAWDFPDHAYWATAVFVVAMATDQVDGWLARRWNQTSAFGSLLDPIADKVLVMSALVMLIAEGVAPAWMVAAIVAREFLVSGLRLAAIEKGIVIAARDLGKLKTWAQAVAVAVGGMAAAGAWSSDVAWWALLVAVVLTWVSGLDYARVAPRLLRAGERVAGARGGAARARRGRPRPVGCSAGREHRRSASRSARPLRATRPDARLPPSRSAARRPARPSRTRAATRRASHRIVRGRVGNELDLHAAAGYASGISRAAVALNDATTTSPSRSPSRSADPLVISPASGPTRTRTRFPIVTSESIGAEMWFSVESSGVARETATSHGCTATATRPTPASVVHATPPTSSTTRVSPSRAGLRHAVQQRGAR